MKYIFVNLKRFDVPRSMGGVNDGPPDGFGKRVVEGIQEGMAGYTGASCAVFFPEAHIMGAKSAWKPGGNLALGCQGVHFANVTPGANFGAYTTSLPAAAASALGCEWTLIGHCEERIKLKTILGEGDGDLAAVNRILAKSVECALASGLKVLYCVGENESEQPAQEQVLRDQLSAVLPHAAAGRIVVGYEPVWAIGPGKTPASQEYITATARYIKSAVDCPVVYGGGLKADNAAMLAGIPEIDGGLIALTRFTGDIGFYPEEFLEIVRLYLET
jgi:triosephosphate isomerase